MLFMNVENALSDLPHFRSLGVFLKQTNINCIEVRLSGTRKETVVHERNKFRHHIWKGWEALPHSETSWACCRQSWLLRMRRVHSLHRCKSKTITFELKIATRQNKHKRPDRMTRLRTSRCRWRRRPGTWERRWWTGTPRAPKFIGKSRPGQAKVGDLHLRHEPFGKKVDNGGYWWIMPEIFQKNVNAWLAKL